MSKVSPCLWFDGEAEEAATFYVSLLPDSRIETVQKNPVDSPGGKAGSVLVVEFTLAGQRFMALNGGRRFEYTHAVSFKIDCADQAEVAHLFRDKNLVSCPVVDQRGRLLGVIMVDDVVDVIDEEAEEDLLKMGGVGIDDMHANPVRTARLRAVWLTVNLATAVLASFVIGQFEGAIEKIVALAVLMPIVASMGGNAGTQTVTVAVRALAMGELTAANAFRFIAKEAAVGGLNGLIFALLMGAAVVAWYGDWRLGAVIGAAMICNLLAAALAGTLIPLGLQKVGVDPAVSSTVFLTTVTDVIGFLAFLELAPLFVL